MGPVSGRITSPSGATDALGYRLTALRAWGHGLGAGLVGWFRVVGALRAESQASNPSLGAEPANASTPPGLFPFPTGTWGALRDPYLLKTLGDRRNRPKGLHRDRSRSRAGSRPHHLYPTRRGLTRNPTGRPLPQASVSGSVSASGSKPFRSVATAGCARTGAAGNSKRDVDIFRRQSILSPRSGPR